jgi:hypothetical protein
LSTRSTPASRNISLRFSTTKVNYDSANRAHFEEGGIKANMSRSRQRINQFNIVYQIYPEVQQQILDLTATLIQILDLSDSDAPYLRELLHHLSITYNSIVITNRDAHQYVNSSIETD